MNPLDSIGRSIKNIFVGSHKGDDFNYDPPEGEYLPENGFTNPLDSMPIATNSNRYAPPEKLAELESLNPRPEEEIADWFNDKKKVEEPKETSMKKKKSIHQKMYEIATAKYNPFAVGGSESINSLGGSENVQKGND